MKKKPIYKNEEITTDAIAEQWARLILSQVEAKKTKSLSEEKQHIIAKQN